MSFQLDYWGSSGRKILEKSRCIATCTYYIISKFQLNLFAVTEVVNVNVIFSSHNLAAHFLKTRNFTITNLKLHNLTSHASIDLIFLKSSLRSPLPISTAFGKTSFRTLCTSSWITSQVYRGDSVFVKRLFLSKPVDHIQFVVSLYQRKTRHFVELYEIECECRQTK